MHGSRTVWLPDAARRSNATKRATRAATAEGDDGDPADAANIPAALG